MDDGKLVTLREMLAARENRAARQRQLLREYGDPLISFTMNLAGPVKRGRLSDLLFWTGGETEDSGCRAGGGVARGTAV